METRDKDINDFVDSIFDDLQEYIYKESKPIFYIKIKMKIKECDKTSRLIVDLIRIRDRIRDEGSRQTISIEGKKIQIDQFSIIIHNLILHNILMYQELSLKLIIATTKITRRKLLDLMESNSKFTSLLNSKIRNPIAHADYDYYDDPMNNLQFFTFSERKGNVEKYVSEDMYDLFMRMQHLHVAIRAIYNKVLQYNPIPPISKEHPLEVVVDGKYINEGEYSKDHTKT